jgi:hypothetical protein
VHENWARPMLQCRSVSKPIMPTPFGQGCDHTTCLHSVPPEHRAPPTHVCRHLILRVGIVGEPHPISLPPHPTHRSALAPATALDAMLLCSPSTTTMQASCHHPSQPKVTPSPPLRFPMSLSSSHRPQRREELHPQPLSSSTSQPPSTTTARQPRPRHRHHKLPRGPLSLLEPNFTTADPLSKPSPDLSLPSSSLSSIVAHGEPSSYLRSNPSSIRKLLGPTPTATSPLDS